MENIVEKKENRGRKKKYFTEEELKEAKKVSARRIYREKHKNAKRGRPRKYETLEEAKEANKKNAIERYHKLKKV